MSLNADPTQPQDTHLARHTRVPDAVKCGLPYELAREICLYCNPNELSALAAVCHATGIPALEQLYQVLELTSETDWSEQVIRNTTNVRLYTRVINAHVVPDLLQAGSNVRFEGIGPWTKLFAEPIKIQKMVLSGLGGPKLSGSWLFELFRPQEIEWRKGGMAIPFSWIVDEFETPTIHNRRDVQVIHFHDVDPPYQLSADEPIRRYTHNVSLVRDLYPGLRHIKIHLMGGVGASHFWQITQEWWAAMKHATSQMDSSTCATTASVGWYEEWELAWMSKLSVHEGLED